MTAPETSEVGERRGSASPTSGHHLTEAHWQAAADAMTGHATEYERVHAVALAIATAEKRGADDVRYGSAWCPDCGTSCDEPHQPQCPTGQQPHEENR